MELNDEKLKCGLCHKCDGKSKLDYPFKRDLLNSDDLVKELMEYVKHNTIYKCKTAEIDKCPDINVYRDSSCRELVCRYRSKVS